MYLNFKKKTSKFGAVEQSDSVPDSQLRIFLQAKDPMLSMINMSGKLSVLINTVFSP